MVLTKIYNFFKHMIHIALEILRSELDAYMQNLPGHEVVLGNVATLDPNSGVTTTLLENRVILSLVNVEEESAFKNLPNTSKLPNGTVQYANPPVFLNLYLLFTANFLPDGNDTNYSLALDNLSRVIQFFQSKSVFNLKNAPGFQNNPEPPSADVSEIQLILNLYTMTFEQINHLWGSLGGRQLPFVMYKARLVELKDRRTTGAGSLIEEIGSNEQAIAPEAS